MGGARMRAGQCAPPRIAASSPSKSSPHGPHARRCAATTPPDLTPRDAHQQFMQPRQSRLPPRTYVAERLKPPG